MTAMVHPILASLPQPGLCVQQRNSASFETERLHVMICLFNVVELLGHGIYKHDNDEICQKTKVLIAKRIEYRRKNRVFFKERKSSPELSNRTKQKIHFGRYCRSQQ